MRFPGAAKYNESIGRQGRWDFIAPICMISLLILGISAIHSAQSAFHGMQWRGQSTWVLGGSILYVFCARIDYRFFQRNAHLLYGGGLVLLLSLWTPLGMSRYGALRWIRLCRIQLQPAEVAKLTTIITLAAALSREKIGNVAESKYILLRLFAIFFVPWVLIFLQPDLGSALILPPILLALLYISELSGKFFLMLAGFIFLVLSLVAWDVFRYRNFLDENGLRPDCHAGLYQVRSPLPLKDYQRNRILGFIAPTAVDPNGTGISWNLRQSLIAVGSGGIFGRGAGGGEQTQLGYIPRSVATNDFLFSALAEEKGFAGSICALILLITLSMNNLRIASLARDRFGKYMAVSIAALLAMHTLINVGMVIGLMPITGVPLPFLSYGGSFLIVCCIMEGIVQSIYNRRQNLR
ncbi:MAG: FtsW/RodA/SpoVE family cell cycle protein [Puniceicoccales bacterium]|jgi:rod shape determining protein RodA|nr:FtsW/RodA/SpoVE family cell cycle protein [Puniceicoccales bacterium]